MALARCPECDELVTIAPTGVRRHPTRGTDTWWSIVVHKHPQRPAVCDGSGARV